MEFYAGRLVATRSIKLALVQRPPQVVQRHSIPHSALVSRPYSTTQKHCCTISIVVLFLRQHPVHFTSLRLYPSPPPCILRLLLVRTAACPSACRQPRDSKTHVEKRLCFCLLLPSGLTLRQTIPPPLISTPKPGSPSRLPLGHHITSDRGVQEHESARPAARW